MFYPGGGYPASYFPLLGVDPGLYPIFDFESELVLLAGVEAVMVGREVDVEAVFVRSGLELDAALSRMTDEATDVETRRDFTIELER